MSPDVIWLYLVLRRAPLHESGALYLRPPALPTDSGGLTAVSECLRARFKAERSESFLNEKDSGGKEKRAVAMKYIETVLQLIVTQADAMLGRRVVVAPPGNRRPRGRLPLPRCPR